MTVVHPSSISEAEVAALIAELAATTPYSDDEWETASFDFDTFEIVITIGLPDGVVGFTQIERLESVIKILPELQAHVVNLFCKPDDSLTSDEHALAEIEVDIEDDAIHLCYVGISFNTQWEYMFHVNADGSWQN